MRKKTFVSAGLLGALALSLALASTGAQAGPGGGGAIGGEITDGAASFSYRSGFPIDDMGLTDPDDFGLCSFGLDGTGQAFQTWWWYRVSTNSQEFPMPVPDTESYVGDTATLTWTNVSAQGFDAQAVLTIAVDSLGSEATLDLDFTVTAASGDVDIEVFHYLDLDLNRSADGDAGILVTDPNELRVSDGLLSFDYTAVGPDEFEVQDFPNLRDSLNDNSETTFTGGGLPFDTSGDWTAGFQFSSLISSGSSQTFETNFFLSLPRPRVINFEALDANPATPGATVTWLVELNEQVTGLGVDDFSLIESGLSGSVITGSSFMVAGSSTVITATLGTGLGSVALMLNDDDSITSTFDSMVLTGLDDADGSVLGPAYNVGTLEEALDTMDLTFGNPVGFGSEWFAQTAVTNDGVDAAQSGPIGDNELSVIGTDMVGPGTLTFFWSVSSEDGSDTLTFFDLNTFTPIDQISGEVPFTQVTHPVPAGPASFAWIYEKDFSIAEGLDAGFLDQVVFTPAGGGDPANYQIDDETSESSGGSSGQAVDFLHVNQFDVVAGQELIEAVDVVFGRTNPGAPASGIVGGEPVTIVVYDDPNNDGDPSDATILASVAGNVTNFDNDTPDRFTLASPVDVGSAGDSFFLGVGFSIPNSDPLFLTGLDETSPQMRSWEAIAFPGGAGDPTDISTYNIPFSMVLPPGNYMIRGVGIPGGGGGDTRTVDIATDEDDPAEGMGMGESIREAIKFSNPGGTIVFAPALEGSPVNVTMGELVIDKDLTIQGPGKDLIDIKSDGTGRVIRIPDGVTATIRGVTISDGNVIGDGGGGISLSGPSGSLTLEDCDVLDNTAEYGGGILLENGTDATISNTTIAGNAATSTAGGGIRLNSGGTAMITKSTISGNTGATGGGGIRASGGTVMLDSSTVSGNMGGSSDAGAGISIGSATITLAKTTVTNNTSSGSGGGVGNSGGTVNVKESIIAGNMAASNADVSGAFASMGFNLIGDDTGSTGFGGSDLLNMAPMLDVLADNGGPTRTHALLAGSPAVDAADPSSMETLDQRGEPRMQDNGGGMVNDIGAFEAAAGTLGGGGNPTLTVTTTIDEDDSALGMGAGNSLRECVKFVDDGGSIDFDPSLDGQVVPLLSTLNITKSMTIAGRGKFSSGGVIVPFRGNQPAPSGTLLTLSSPEQRTAINNRHMFIDGGVTVNLSGMTLSGGTAQGGDGGGGAAGMGGSIFVNDGNLAIDSVAFQNNTAQGGNGVSSVVGTGVGGGGLGGDGVSGGDGGGGGPLGGTGGVFPAGDAAGDGAGGAGGTDSSDTSTDDGGDGGFGGGGGGGGGGGDGGDGGFGGGGGGGGDELFATAPGTGGAGGLFGGDGADGGVGGFGGGGGGGGLGGAVFLRQGSLTVSNSDFDNNVATGGVGSGGGNGNGTDGLGKGGALFINMGATFTNNGGNTFGATTANSASDAGGFAGATQDDNDLFLFGGPLSVELESFEAFAPTAFQPVRVRWTTSAEIDNVGFYVHRAERENARASWTLSGEPLNATLIPGRGNPSRGAEYVFTDSEWSMERERAYFLSDIDLSGRETLHGPAFLTIGREPIAGDPVPAQEAPASGLDEPSREPARQPQGANLPAIQGSIR